MKKWSLLSASIAFVKCKGLTKCGAWDYLSKYHPLELANLKLNQPILEKSIQMD